MQAALEAAAEGRTTITIAHRLSTIKDAHNIVVMSQGAIVEQGTHDALLQKQGAYYNLVTAQNIAAVQAPANAEEDEEDDDARLIRRISTSRSGGGYSEDPDDNIAAKLKRSSTQASVSSRVLKNRKPEEEIKYTVWTLVKLIASFNRTEWKLMIWGLFWSIICGGGNPVQALFFAKQILVRSILASSCYSANS